MHTTNLCHSNRQEVVYVDTFAKAAHTAVTHEKCEQVHEPYHVNPRFRGLGKTHVTFVLRKVTWRSNPPAPPMIRYLGSSHRRQFFIFARLSKIMIFSQDPTDVLDTVQSRCKATPPGQPSDRP